MSVTQIYLWLDFLYINTIIL